MAHALPVCVQSPPNGGQSIYIVLANPPTEPQRPNILFVNSYLNPDIISIVQCDNIHYYQTHL